MKRSPLLALILLLVLLSEFKVQAQTTLQPCFFSPSYEATLFSDTNQLLTARSRFERARAAVSNGNQSLLPPAADTLWIPVVVHVFHNPSETVGQGLNISYQQILSQIDRLNADFANDTVFTSLPSGQWAVNTKIRFCLARIPMGPSDWTDSLEPGVMRYPVSTAILNDTTTFPNPASAQQILNVTHPSGSYFPFANYLNIWTLNSIITPSGQGLGGYSPIPVGQVLNYPLDGIVIDAHVFGDNTVNNNNFPILYPQYNTGNICAHEAGHYLGMLHPFTSGCSGMTNADCATNGDFICDTPPTTYQGPLCAVMDSCTENISPFGNRNDMVENFMMWTDDNCQTTFTSDQGDAMRGYLLTGRTTLCSTYNLGLTGVASPTGCIPPVLVAQMIYPSPACQNVSLSFSTPTGMGFSAVTWSWTFQGGSPSTSTSNNPNVIFATAGQHQVILTAFDVNGNAVSDTVQLYISPCAPLQSTQGVWYFGERAGVNFGSGTAVHDDQAFINNTIRTREGAASVCDSMGALIFYTDGDTVWDRNHQAAIVGLLDGQGYSKAQILVVPHPSVPHWYYLFHGSSHSFPFSGWGPMVYSIIRDTLNTMQAVQLNVSVPLPPGATSTNEGITAIPHCNGRDWWIIATTFDSVFSSPVNEQLHTYLLSPAGLTDTSGTSPFPVITQTAHKSSFWGHIKASPKGNKIARSGWSAGLVYDFDPLTGLISNEQVLSTSISAANYSCTFSPDGNSVYFGLMGTGIEAFDLTQPNPTFVTIAANGGYCDFQIGPDSAVYVSFPHDTAMTRIGNPNNILSPNYVSNAVPLATVYPQIRGYEGLPNMIDPYPVSPSPIAFTATYNSCTQIAFSALGCWNYYDFHWNFGDATTSSLQNPVHNYASTGTYTVTLTLSIGSYSTSVSQVVNIINSAPVINGPLTVCTGSLNPSVYNVTSVYSSYQWSVTGGGTIVSVSNQQSVDVSWSSSGTLTCQVSNGPNCTFTTTILVTVHASPTANAGPDVQLCGAGIALLSGSASGGNPPYSYSWTPAAPVTNPNAASTTANLTTTTLFGLSVTDANGCSSVDYMAVTVDTSLNPPVVSFAPIAQQCDNVAAFSLLPFATPAGGSFTGPGVTGSNFNPALAVAPDTNTLYYFYTDTTTGCTGNDSSFVYVYNCCNTSSGVNTVNGQASSAFGPQFNAVPVPVRINGTFYINNTFFINGYTGANTVRCASNATIVVKTGARLVIQLGSTLAPCDDMWNGIIVEPGGELEILTNSTIRGAKQAVVSKNGAKFTLDQAVLRDNYQNIIVESYTGQGLHPGTIVRSRVIGTSLTLAPYVGVKTFSGMEITGVDSIYVGTPTTTFDENEFRGMDIGIITTGSNVYVRNNQFRNITSTQVTAIPSCCAIGGCGPNVICNPPPKGTAIWSTGNNVTIGGSSLAYQNRFNTCTRGILAENSINTRIQNNRFQSITSSSLLVTTYCINVRLCKTNTEIITDNVISGCKNGILFGFSSFTTAIIETNDINNLGGTGIQVTQTTDCPVSIGFNTINATATSNGKYGIRVANAVISNNTRYVEIHGNITKKVEKHIWVTNFDYITIDSSNNMQFVNGVPSTAQFGIQVQNSNDALVDGNTVVKNGAIPLDTNYRKRLYGISMETNCYNSQVSNNGLFKMGTGIQFFNSSNFPSTISCNSMTNNMWGVHLNNTFVGNQGNGVSVPFPNGVAQDNKWTIQSAQSGFYRAVVGSGTSPVGTTWYYRSSTGGYLPTPTQIQPLFFVTFSGPLSNAPSLCVQPCPTCLVQSNLSAIAARSTPFDTLSYAPLFLSDQNVFAQLRANQALMAMGTQYDSTLASFYAQNTVDNIGFIDDAYLKASQGDTTGAALAKDGIIPRGDPDLNHKLILEIYLRSWGRNQFYFTPQDSAILYAIATQNVLYGGTAVYDARVMLDIDIDDIGFGSALRLSTPEPDTIGKGVVYPNPTTGTTTYYIELNDDESGYIVITDIFGRPVNQLPLNAGSNQAEISFAELPSGIYLYRSVINGATRETGKIVVDK